MAKKIKNKENLDAFKLKGSKFKKRANPQNASEDDSEFIILIENGEEMNVPIQDGNRHYELYKEFILEGNVPEEKD